MTSPFDSAWVLLKATMQRRLDPSSWLSYTRDLPDFFANATVRDPVRLEMEAEQRHRKLLDAKDRFKQQLNQHIPRLERQQGSYGVKVGPRNVGKVGTTTAERDDPQNNWTSLDEGKIADDAQRQGLYGRALQGIINDAGSLTSYSRNENSQPFHEQFNPVSATKNIGDQFLERIGDITYTAKPPKETPRGWGDLQYDTGALPVFDWRREAEDPVYHFDGLTQQTLAPHTYIPTPGGVTYGRR